MANRDGEEAGCRLSQTAVSIRIGGGDQVGLLLARGVHPAGEPLDGKLALRCAETPRARPDGDLGAQPAETVDSGFHRVRAEQAPARRSSALVGVERRCYLRVKRIRREQLNVAADGESEQHRAPGAGAGVDQPRQLLPRQQVEQGRGGNERRPGEVVGTELIADCLFRPEGDSQLSDDVWRAVEGGFLRAVSVGFTPTGLINELVDSAGNWTGYEFTSQELLELSVVPVPANPQALAVAKSLGIADATARLLFTPDPRAVAQVAVEARRRSIDLLKAQRRAG